MPGGRLMTMTVLLLVCPIVLLILVGGHRCDRGSISSRAQGCPYRVARQASRSSAASQTGCPEDAVPRPTGSSKMVRRSGQLERRTRSDSPPSRSRPPSSGGTATRAAQLRLEHAHAARCQADYDAVRPARWRNLDVAGDRSPRRVLSRAGTSDRVEGDVAAPASKAIAGPAGLHRRRDAAHQPRTARQTLRNHLWRVATTPMPTPRLVHRAAPSGRFLSGLSVPAPGHTRRTRGRGPATAVLLERLSPGLILS